MIGEIQLRNNDFFVLIYGFIIYSDSSTSDGWMYKLDEEKRTVTLLRYTGGDTNITVPASLNINGISYIVILQGMNSEEEFSFPKETKSVTISDGVKAAEDISYLFNGYSSYKRESMNLAELDVSGLDTSSTKNMSGLFNHCSVTDLDVSTFDTKNVTNMSYMFNGCNNLKNLNMNGLNTANVEDMSYMFGECHNFNRLDVSSFDTVTVNDMSGMFSYCISLKKLKVLPLSRTFLI